MLSSGSMVTLLLGFEDQLAGLGQGGVLLGLATLDEGDDRQQQGHDGGGGEAGHDPASTGSAIGCLGGAALDGSVEERSFGCREGDVFSSRPLLVLAELAAGEQIGWIPVRLLPLSEGDLEAALEDE